MRRLLTAGVILAEALALSLPFAVAVPGGAAHAQSAIESREGIALQNQILELRNEVEQLRQGGGGVAPAPAGPTALGGYQGGAAPGPSADVTAQLLDRVQRLEEAVRELRGRIDEVDNARRRQGDDLAKQIGDLNFKIDTMGGAKPGAVPAVAPPAAPTAPAPATPAPATGSLPTPPTPPARRTPELALQEGNAAYARRDYAGAETAAKEVLAMPPGPRTADANYLLAQSLAARKDWQGAAVAYDDAYRRARTGSRAQDSLLGLATALIAINEKKAACETLSKLRTEFPQPRADLRDDIAGARKRAACG